MKKIEKTEGESQWFLPHFAVIKDDRTTTKTQIVFDAAGKDSGRSLNDAIHSAIHSMTRVRQHSLTILSAVHCPETCQR